MLEQGEKLLIVHRRLFEKDSGRFFVGDVQAYEDGIVKVKGYTFVRDMWTGAVNKKSDIRTKVVSLVSGTFIVYLLPETVHLDLVKISGEVLTDDRGFTMDVSESVSKEGSVH